MSNKYPYFIVLFDHQFGLATVVKTNGHDENLENHFRNGIEAHLYAKELMDDWLKQKMDQQMDKFRENRSVVK